MFGLGRLFMRKKVLLAGVALGVGLLQLGYRAKAADVAGAAPAAALKIGRAHV